MNTNVPFYRVRPLKECCVCVYRDFRISSVSEECYVFEQTSKSFYTKN